MSAKRWFGVGFVAACAAPVVAWAHPGHGIDGGSHGVWHYVTEPLHVAVGLGVLALALTGLALKRRQHD